MGMMSCGDCKEQMGTAFLIEGSVPEHKTPSEHWVLVREHKAAKSILMDLVDLVGAEAVARELANIGRAFADQRPLKATFAELGR